MPSKSNSTPAGKDSPKTKAERREAARAEALALRAAQERKDKLGRAMMLGALVVGLTALFVIIAYVLINSSGSDSGSGSSSQTPFVAGSPKPLSEVKAPATADDTGGFPVGAAGAAGTVNEGAPRVDVYLDFMCPLCGQLETLNAATLDDMRAQGTATVVYHPIAILDSQSQGTGFSSRSAAAAAYVASQAPDKFLAFNAAIFENQPEEGSVGLTDAEMQKLAKEAGVPAEVAAKIGDGTATATYGEWVTAQTAADGSNPELQYEDQGKKQFGTPTITINGVRWDGNWTQEGALADAVAQAAKK